MTPQIFQTGKLSDKKIVEFYEKLRGVAQVSSATMSISNSSIGLDDWIEAGIEQDTKYIQKIVFQTNFGRVTYFRGVTISHGPQQHDNKRRPDPFIDEFIYEPANNNLKPDCIPVFDLIEKYQVLVSPDSVASSGNSVLELLQLHISSLSETHNRMVEDSAELQNNLNQQYAANTAKLEEERENLKLEIANESRKEQEKVKALHTELEEAKKLVDDRNHMHVRRELREKITDDAIEQAEKVSTGFVGPHVFLFALFVACVSAAIAVHGFLSAQSLLTTMEIKNSDFFRDALRSEAVDAANRSEIIKSGVEAIRDQYFWLIIAAGARGVAASIATLTFLTFCLSWLRTNFNRRERQKEDFLKYGLDMNRASWVIETIIEMKSAGDTRLPSRWIEGACNGLFQNEVEKTGETTPLEALGALLNVTGKARIGPDGTELELDRKDLRKAAKSGAS